MDLTAGCGLWHLIIDHFGPGRGNTVEKMRKFYAIHSSHLFINIQGSFLIKIILVWNLQIPISPQLSLHFKLNTFLHHF